MKNQNGSSRVDTVLKMMIIGFISLLAFSSGVWFGKSLSDSDHKLKALESDFSSASHTAQMDSKREDGQEDPLAEEEVASISEKFVTDQRDELGGETKGETKGEGKSERGVEKATMAEGRGDAHVKKETRTVASTEATAEKAHGIEKNSEKVNEKSGTHGATTAKTEAKTGKPDLSAAHEAAERVAHNADPSETGKTSTHTAVHTETAAAHETAHVDAHEASHEATREVAHATGTKTTTTAHAAEPAKSTKTTVASNRSTDELAPAKANRSERAPSSAGLPKTVGTAGEVEFTVQIAAFPTADLAKNRADELVKKGFPAFPVEATVNGRTWFRVSVGSFKTMKEAAGYRAQLLKQADLTEAIVQRIQR